jgi:FkbM family methyltransferase
MQSISLCLIVRDESKNVRACLESFAGAYDEAVVIDTGSLDNTIEEARAAGAKCQLFQWRDDFAAARQFSFDQATGDWLLWCDADDRLAVGEASEIRKAVEANDADVIFLNRNVNGIVVPREMLIRRGFGTWDRAVHERMIFAQGAREKHIAVTVNHPPVLGKKVSHERNLMMLEKSLQNTPMDLFYFATELHMKGERERARAAATAALQLGLGIVERYELLIMLALCADEWQERERYALSAFNLMPGRREAMVMLSQSAMKRGDKGRALTFARMIHAQPRPKESIWTLQAGWYGWDGIDLFLCALRANGLYFECQNHELKLRKNAPPKFSLIHATRGRPKQMMECRERWFSSAKHPEAIEHIFIIDDDDIAEVKEAVESHWHITLPAGGGCVAAWNAGAKHSQGEILIQLSDDWIPPMHWDELILERLGSKAAGEAVLAVSDGIDRGGGEQTKCMCMAIMTRARYLHQGHMFFSGYKSVYSDNEFSDRAEADGVVVDARDLIFRHMHPVNGTAAMDATYKAQNAPERYREGEATYLARKQATGAITRKYGALVLAVKDDLCLFEVCKRLHEEGVNDFFFGIPTEYWNGKPNTQDNAMEVRSVAVQLGALGCRVRTIAMSVKAHRVADPLITEAEVRNDLLARMRSEGFDHVLVVDGDELWKKGALREVDRYITDNAPHSISCPIIPVAGLPGYPIDGARDGAMIYLGPGAEFGSCRGQKGETAFYPRRLLYHFTATRKTMEEIISKTRESGHYTDPRYHFEEWIEKTLPNIKPGMKRAHMYTEADTWPTVREWTEEDMHHIPASIRQHLGTSQPIEKTKFMQKYSQNNEQEIIAQFFGDKVGSFLDIGAFTGKELSNTRALMERGWCGMCVEASPRCFVKLMENCAEFKDRVICVNACAGSDWGMTEFHDSLAACATTDVEHYRKWSQGVNDWQTIVLPVAPVNRIIQLGKGIPHYDFISIDTEGMDWVILQQLNLEAMGTRMVCVEYGKHGNEILDFMTKAGFKMIHQNQENLIFTK